MSRWKWVDDLGYWVYTITDENEIAVEPRRAGSGWVAYWIPPIKTMDEVRVAEGKQLWRVKRDAIERVREICKITASALYQDDAGDTR